MANMLMIAYMFGHGMKTTSCTMVGIKIGSGDYKGTIRYFRIAALFTVILVFCEASLIYTYKEKITEIISPLDSIRKIILSVFPLLAINIILDCIRASL